MEDPGKRDEGDMKEKTQNTLIVIASVIILIIIIFFALKIIANYVPEIKENQSEYLVAEIIDGDTFRLDNGDIVRLLCVDTPEKGEEGYDEAVSFLGGRLIYQNNITLEGNTTDRYGRLLRWVWAEGSLVNKEIIDEDLGEIFEYAGEDCGGVIPE